MIDDNSRAGNRYPKGFQSPVLGMELAPAGCGAGCASSPKGFQASISRDGPAAGGGWMAGYEEELTLTPVSRSLDSSPLILQGWWRWGRVGGGGKG